MSDAPLPTPRISVNKLGEYMVATPRRRRRIVSDQKNPRGFIVARYNEAQDAIARFLAAGAEDDGILLGAIETLYRTTPQTEWDAQRIELSIEALESFLELADGLDMEGIEAQRSPNAPPRLEVAGVSISVRPEVWLRRTTRGKPEQGGVKLYFAKSIPLTEAAAGFVGTALREHLARTLPERGAVNHRLCWIIDIFAGRIHLAPRAHAQRMADVEAACEEIARAWEAV